MLIVTTLSYDQLGSFIRNKQVSLDNENLLFGKSFPPIKKYLTERLGGSGYVIGIRGRINENSVKLLSQLDKGLQGNKVIIEAPVSEDEIMTFNVQDLEEAAQILMYGLPDEILYNHLDNALLHDKVEDGIEIICVPAIRQSYNIRITSLNRDITIDAEGITFVKMRG